MVAEALYTYQPLSTIYGLWKANDGIQHYEGGCARVVDADIEIGK